MQQLNEEKKESISPHSRKINYTEFLARCLDIKEQISDIKLHNIFKEFSQGKSFFTREDMTQFLARKGRKLSRGIVSQMMSEVDSNQDGKVTFEEFMKLMKDSYENYSNKHSERKDEYKVPSNFSEQVQASFQKQQEERKLIQLKPICEQSEESKIDNK
eukprot:TRINITY_DN5426_c0_g1_i3.p5 TRINITY_DN5426_c0_g1~~TRINITY_DN5426_c0_g1_i3.p5  ORF type:complete len:159 (-),score=28.68 TRINITY_DN5426_c0_g1_i3:220-696(-)